jgi:hypothetical protein
MPLKERRFSHASCLASPNGRIGRLVSTDALHVRKNRSPRSRTGREAGRFLGVQWVPLLSL